MRRLSAWFIAAVLTFSAAVACARQEVRSVERVLDGDTIVLDNHARVRLIGVDAPETHDSARNYRGARRAGADPRSVDRQAVLAARWVRAQIEGRQVRLEYDPAHPDKYGRILAYVWRNSDNLFINAEIVRLGHGFAYTRFPFSYAKDFKLYQRQARSGRRGLWEKPVPS